MLKVVGEDRRDLDALLTARTRLVLKLSSIFMVFHLLDRIVYPAQADRWLVYRLVVFAFASIVYAITLNRPMKSHFMALIYGFAFSAAISLMVYESGGFESTYYVGVLLLAAVLTVLFPLELSRGVQLLGLVLLPYLAATTLHAFQHGAELHRAVLTLTFMLSTSAFMILGSHLTAGLFVRERRTHRRMQRMVENLEESSRRDPLTRLFNRRHLRRELERALGRNALGEGGFGFALADLDHFKRLNDRFGHPAGDLALRKVAEALVRATRSEDVVCRFGGEEFAMLLPDAGPGTVCVAAERLRRAVEALAVRWEDETLELRMSVGVTTARLDDDAESLIARADEALYRAKAAGRNCVVCAEDDAAAPPKPRKPRARGPRRLAAVQES